MSPEERAALHQRTLETAPQLADGKAEADQGVEDCKTDGFCFASSWRAETLAVAAPLLPTPHGDSLARWCALPALQSQQNRIRKRIGPGPLVSASPAPGLSRRRDRAPCPGIIFPRRFPDST